MKPRLLLDTHTLLRWLRDERRLSREQANTLSRAIQRNEPLAFSAVSLLEITMLANQRKVTFKTGVTEFFEEIQRNPVLRLFPLSYEIALDAGSLAFLKDPADRTIVATARVHGLSLLTSDQRILASDLVPVIE